MQLVNACMQASHQWKTSLEEVKVSEFAGSLVTEKMDNVIYPSAQEHQPALPQGIISALTKPPGTKPAKSPNRTSSRQELSWHCYL